MGLFEPTEVNIVILGAYLPIKTIISNRKGLVTCQVEDKVTLEKKSKLKDGELTGGGK